MEAALQRLLKTAKSKSEIRKESGRATDPQYQQLEQGYEQAYQASTRSQRATTFRNRSRSQRANLLAVQKRLHRQARLCECSDLQIETETSASGKQSKQERNSTPTRRSSGRSSFPTVTREIRLPPTGRKIQRPQRPAHQAERCELGEVLKPVTEATEDDDLHRRPHGRSHADPDRGSQEEDDGVGSEDRADQRGGRQYRRPLRVLPHGNIREPLKITPAVMTPKGEKKPDEYAQAFTSHPESRATEDSRS
jgi:hypothetical protein